ncbi:MAG TPA: GNVR domain-containing protein [Terriglobales bacterium]|nr:GNVR domain-containing protein [Terriglobales bacterium]
MFDELEDNTSQARNWEYYRGILRRRCWWLVLPAFVVWGAVWGVSWFLPASYKSETLIIVEQQTVPEHYVVPNVTNDLQDRLQSMTQQILSRTRLMRIIDQFQLYGDLRSHLSLDEMVDKMRRDIKIQTVRAEGRQEGLAAFRISYSSSEPRVAQQVAGQLTSLFIDENLKTRAQQSENTTSFLESQLDEARKTLAEQEKRVKEFKSKNLGTLPDQLNSNLNIMNGLESRLQGELQAVNQAKQQGLYLQSLLDQYRSIRTGLKEGSNDPEVPPALDQELTRLKEQLADLQSHYTERHPDYRKVKQQIAQLEKMKQQMANDLAAAASQNNTAQNGAAQSNAAQNKNGNTGAPRDTGKSDVIDAHPTSFAEMREMSPMLQLEGQVQSNQMDIQNREKLVTRLEAQIQEYQTRLNEAPVREEQFADLTRDYNQSRANYDSLLSKRNQSELATSLEKRQQGEQFRIIDPPSFPAKPYKPDRMLFGFAGLLAGVFVSVAAVTSLELVDDRIYDESDFEKLVKAPVLTEIPPLPTALETIRQHRQIRLQWAGGVTMLLLIAGSFLYTYHHG